VGDYESRAGQMLPKIRPTVQVLEVVFKGLTNCVLAIDLQEISRLYVIFVD
jgi:hypothetical protein